VQMMKVGLLVLCACAAVPAPASAQQMQWTDKGFVSANVGVQVGSHDLNGTQTFTLYDEPATLTAVQKVGSGPLFDLGGGYRVWSNVLVGVAYSWSSSNSDAAIAGSIPDPVFFDRPRAVTATASDLTHTENALHLDATWMMPVTDKIDVGFSAGPTIFFVKQEHVTALPVTEPGPTVGTPTLAKDSKTSVGVNFGVDVNYLLGTVMGKPWGVGGLARYSWGSVTLDGVSEKMTVGGFQLAAGARMRF